MNQDQNNFNVQGNNGIPNNQPLQNNQNLDNNFIQPQQGNLNYQQASNNFNNFDNNQQFGQPSSTFNMENKPPKKNNIGLIIGVVIGIIAVVLGIVFSSDLFDNNQKTNKNNSNAGSNIDNNNTSNENESKCVGTNQTLTDLKGDTVDYYYNIDTSKFNKNLFDGNINFFGVTINGKITPTKLKNLGISVDGGMSRLKDDGSRVWDSANFSIDTSSDIINNSLQWDNMGSSLQIRNYFGNMDLFANDTLITLCGSFCYNLSGRNLYPLQLGINDYSEITIDLILEKLGNPTYVNGRTNSCLENKYTYTTYVYVYDDVAFLYSFYNWDNMKLASVFYYPIEDLNGVAPQTMTFNGTNYNNPLEVFKLQQQEYLNNQK